MIAIVDVDYRDTEAVAACLLADAWADDRPAAELVERITPVEPYEPGSFYRRELPCLLAVLRRVTGPIAAVVVDGYAWLGDGRPGLGARLADALGGTVPVVGVAKTRFAGAPAVEVLRPGSRRPLFVTAAGLNADEAARQVVAMHGPYRIPTLLRLVDKLCRGAEK
jgi:deoxyribonuclease V